MNYINMNYKLHYAKLDLGEQDIPCYEFKTHADMVDFIDKGCYGNGGSKIWLIAKEDSNDVFVSESHLSIQDFLNNKYLWQIIGNYYLQEYESYEAAYKVALDMMEVSPLCYS